MDGDRRIGDALASAGSDASFGVVNLSNFGDAQLEKTCKLLEMYVGCTGEKHGLKVRI